MTNSNPPSGSPSPSRDNTGQEPDRFQHYPYRFITGQKIKFKSEKQRYTVQCESRRYAICTKPFNAQKTVLYCIIDQWRNVRGPENLVFGMGAETREECLEMLVRLLDNESEVSYRHYAPLDIEAVYEGNDVVAPRSEATQGSLQGATGVPPNNELFKIIEPAMYNYPDKHYIDQALAGLTTYISTLCNEVIGEDDKTDVKMARVFGGDIAMRTAYNTARNTLRAEQRERLRKLQEET